MKRDDVTRMLRFYGSIDREIRGLRDLQMPKEDQELHEKKMNNLKSEISHALLGLPCLEREVIFAHYVLGRKWSQIRCRYHYSDKQIRNISNKGLLALGKRLENSEAVRHFLHK